MIRTFHHRESSAAQLVERKGATRLSVVLPARDEAATIGPIVEALRSALVDDVPLVDELVVMDDHSVDRTAAIASDAGARVESAAEVHPELGLGPGKGEAMWKSLAITDGDVVAWCDADIREFDVRFVVGILGPLLDHEDLALVKGYYDRPVGRGDAAGGGRVTELVARPLVSLLFPQLAPIVQPLAGEYGGRRTVLEAVPFTGGYGVELGLLIDIAERFGPGAIAQVDLGERIHRNRPLDELGPQAAAVIHTALDHVAPDLLDDDAVLVRPGVEPVRVTPAQLPPMCEIRRGRRDSA
jgi:glucosyl-3-phosphoglycerate synthase